LTVALSTATAPASESYPPATTSTASALRVDTVERLNERRYDASVFEAHGIRHADLPFDDCAPPSAVVVATFLHAADAAAARGGLVAVHCHAGLGRTGTLIALRLCLMRNHGFTAREAMGWLRIMRPGSVIGEQQRFLCDFEARAAPRAAPRADRRATPRATAAAAGITYGVRRSASGARRPAGSSESQYASHQHKSTQLNGTPKPPRVRSLPALPAGRVTVDGAVTASGRPAARRPLRVRRWLDG
jgi:protein-tyrosine phosphatase